MNQKVNVLRHCNHECQKFILLGRERCCEVLDGFRTYGDTFYYFSGLLSRSLLLLQSWERWNKLVLFHVRCDEECIKMMSMGYLSTNFDFDIWDYNDAKYARGSDIHSIEWYLSQIMRYSIWQTINTDIIKVEWFQVLWPGPLTEVPRRAFYL